MRPRIVYFIEESMRPFRSFVAIVALSLLLSACSESKGLSGRETGAIGGGALGAGLGAIIGHATGRTGEGIAIGAGVGALSGGLLGNESDVQDERYKSQDEALRRQEEELRRQRREIQELRGNYSDEPYGSSRDRNPSDRYDRYDRYEDSYRY